MLRIDLVESPAVPDILLFGHGRISRLLLSQSEDMFHFMEIMLEVNGNGQTQPLVTYYVARNKEL
jgi:hypothetical protein